jgi:hypothetical protein
MTLFEQCVLIIINYLECFLPFLYYLSLKKIFLKTPLGKKSKNENI